MVDESSEEATHQMGSVRKQSGLVASVYETVSWKRFYQIGIDIDKILAIQSSKSPEV